jgi:hypothetical protein
MKTAAARAKVEFGDFQTPSTLAHEVCAVLLRHGVRPSRIIEPTCGVGAFLQAAAQAYPATPLAGFEINPGYAQAAQSATLHATVAITDFFAHDWDAELHHDADPLLLGNPPWVTSAAVSVVQGANLPLKENIYGLRGLAAKTGKANFDIAEWIILRLLRTRHGRPATLAVLCKTATARKVLRHAWRGHLPISTASLHLIDAAAQFGAAVDACLFIARLGAVGAPQAEVFATLDAKEPSHRIGLAGADLVADLDAYRRLSRFEGLFPFQWRSGIKHDCASVLELSTADNGTLVNKAGQVVAVEPAALFPWCKSTALARHQGVSTQWLLLPQGALGESTEARFAEAPRALAYLQANRTAFAARKSSIYKRGGPFAIFGVGDYTFSPWKVAVSALHRPIRFVVVGPKAGQPVLFDDTCYYLSFGDEGEADAVAKVLNSPECIEFLDTLIFPGAKRAVTVELLQRLDFRALALAAGVDLARPVPTGPVVHAQYELLSFGT